MVFLGLALVLVRLLNCQQEELNHFHGSKLSEWLDQTIHIVCGKLARKAVDNPGASYRLSSLASLCIIVGQNGNVN